MPPVHPQTCVGVVDRARSTPIWCASLMWPRCAYVGKAVIRETITLVDGDTYRGEATATIFDAAGNTLAVVPSQTVASRMNP